MSAALLQAMTATWPAAQTRRVGPWILREGEGGGNRVSAATAEAPVSTDDLRDAERGMRDLGQKPLFMVRAGEDTLDALLDAAGYAVRDPVVVYETEVSALAERDLPRLSAFTHWPPLAIVDEIWRDGGIAGPRRAVIDRAPAPKIAVLARADNRPAGALFAATHGRIAMVHAVETLPALRRRGAGRHMMIAAARWARDRGASVLALAVTRENAPAVALYESLGMRVATSYHYRVGT
ncbi:GNAT family N-acetyltransferase [Tranquillimonas rosea]|uniref:GNAT family N-acetyltransferase n=1 Tax=Tranquillimonas rosea TaxID=641238 RepID=UPI003BA97D34